MNNQNIILASASPRRHQLLQQAEVPFTIHISNVEETYPSELTMEQIPIHIAMLKAKAVQTQVDEEATIIGADTIVVCNNKVIGKPTDAADALQILLQLNGQTHTVITGVCILKKNEEPIQFSDSTKVTFHTLQTQQLQHYIEKYKPYDKAGAYAIQEWIGVVGIKSIEGCFYNVMGLPVSRILPFL